MVLPAQAEILRISKAKHMPLYCLERLSSLCRTARTDPKEHLMTDIIHSTMDANLTQFGALLPALAV
jgi:hypothetical protein